MLLGQLEKDDLNAKLGKLSNRIQQVKVDAFDELREKYEEYNPDPSLLAVQSLASRVDELQSNMDHMAQRIEKDVRKLPVVMIIMIELHCCEIELP